MRMHWFLPETPMCWARCGLRPMRRSVVWSRSPPWRAARPTRGRWSVGRTRGGRDSPHPAGATTPAFSTPVDQEDLYSLSELLDGVLNAAKNIVRETDVLAIDPDERAGELAAELVEGMSHIVAGFGHLTGKGTGRRRRPTRRWLPSAGWRRSTVGPCTTCWPTRTCVR